MYRLYHLKLSGRLIGTYLIFPALIFLLVVLLPVLSSFSGSTINYTHLSDSLSNQGSGKKLVGLTGDEKRAIDSLASLAAFAQARLSNSESDRISLSLDLSNRLMQIEIGGVPVRRCQVNYFDLSHSLAPLQKPVTDLESLSKPFVLSKLQSTIPRIPVRVVKAPKDSVEARSRPPLEVPEEKERTIYKMWFDHGLTVTIAESQSSFPGFLTEAVFVFQTRLRTLTQSITSIIQGRLPESEKWIRIELSGEDAKAILRAIPDSTQLALRLP